VQPAQFLRRFNERWMPIDLARQAQRQKLIQLITQCVQIDLFHRRRYGAIHTAINAVEITDLVRVEIDSDRQSPATPAYHRIHESIALPKPAVLREKLELSVRFKHDSHSTARCM